MACTVQTGTHRTDRAPDDFRDLLVGKLLDIGQDHYLALIRGERRESLRDGFTELRLDEFLDGLDG